VEHDLVDELRLMIYPCALGTGDRLFAQTSGSKPMQLVDARVVGDDLAHLSYRPVRTAQPAGARDTVRNSSA
jgi:dihydrofolate reductase